MAVMQDTETFVIERVINASQETLFEMWTVPEKLNQWLTIAAETDPTAGGVATLSMGGPPNDPDAPFVSNGHFTVVEPHDHLEFTWGFSVEKVGVPQESSTVAVDFVPQSEGTLVRVTHSGLPLGRHLTPFDENEGWKAMLASLAEAASA